LEIIQGIHLSIFNSKTEGVRMKKRKLPTALLVTVFFIIFVELVVKSIPLEKMISYEMGAATYVMAQIMIEEDKTPDIMFIGSSRVAQGIIPSIIKSSIDSETGQQFEVGNYGIGGASSSDIVPMVKALLKQKKLPKVIFWGISPYQFKNRGDSYTLNSPVFWNMSDWWRVHKEIGFSAWRLLPTVIRNELGKYYLTLKYRRLFVPYVRNMYRSFRGANLRNPFMGDPSAVHDDPQIQLQADDALVKKIQILIEKQYMDDGEFYVNTLMLAKVRDVAEELTKRGVKIIFFETSFAPIWNDQISPQAIEKYRNLIRSNIESDFLYIKPPPRGMLSNVDFLNATHLNKNGSVKYTRFLLDSVRPYLLESIIEDQKKHQNPEKFMKNGKLVPRVKKTR
jgi:hypothetical protein